MTNVVVFLGPTLAVEDARTFLDATYLPPAGQGDLLNATMQLRPAVIGLVDGLFYERLSVWHKEILHAIDRGIVVFGASSMGALRAAETASFGMRGVGEIYRMYADGVIEDDDEVALAHAGPDDGYRALSEAMVNVRATLDAACSAGVLAAGEAAAVCEIAKRMYFPDRTYPAIWRAAALAGLSATVLDGLRRFVATSRVDLKRRDAIAMLHAIRDMTDPGSTATPIRPAPPFDFVHATFDALYNRDRLVRRSGVDVPLEAIGYQVALHDEKFDDLNFRALNRTLAQVLARVLGVGATVEEIDAEVGRFRSERGLDSDDGMLKWLDDNDLDDGEFRDLMTEVATCRRLHRWIILSRWMERTTRIVLDQLRLEDRYGEWADRAATQESLLEGVARSPGTEGAPPLIDELLAEHARWTGIRPAVAPDIWAEEAGFHSVGNLRFELAQASRARSAMLGLLADAMSDEP